MTGFKTLEKKFGIKVVDDSIWNPWKGKYIKAYKMYTADGCCWEKGLSREGVKRECQEWAEALLEIKKGVTR